jgi:glycosyltransferase involved in cell wall biosynthesis
MLKGEIIITTYNRKCKLQTCLKSIDICMV